MKYTILGFQQEKLLELGLKLEDALILRSISDMYSSASMEFLTHEGQVYMWINQTYLINQIPIIGSKRSLRNRLKILEDKGLIHRLLRRERKGKRGSFSYLAPSFLLESLEDYDLQAGQEKASQGPGKDFPEAGKDLPNKDSSSIDNSIRDKNTPSPKSLDKEVKDRIIKSWNQLGLNQLRGIKTGTRRNDMLRARIDEFSLDEIFEAIEEVARSSFLKGENERGWTISFDWLLKPNNFIKVLEANYRDREREVVKDGEIYEEDGFNFGISI